MENDPLLSCAAETLSYCCLERAVKLWMPTGRGRSVGENEALLDSTNEVSRLNRIRLTVVAAAVVACASAYSAHLTSFLHAKEAALALCTGFLGILLILHGRVSRGSAAFLLPLVVVAVLCTASGALGFTNLGRASMVELVRWTILAAFILCMFDLLEKERTRCIIHDAIVGSAALVGLLAIVQYLRIAPFLFPDYEGKAHALYSVFGNPGLLGGYLAVGLPLAFYGMAVSRRGYIVRWVACATVVAALALSGTRSAWIAALAGTAFIVLTGRLWNRRALIGACTLGLTVLCVVLLAPEITAGRMRDALHGSDPSMGLRYWFWAGAIEMIREHPWFGVGPGNFGYFSPGALAAVLHSVGGEHYVHNELYTDHAHNDVLELVAELGVIGVLPFLWWWVRLFRSAGPEWGGLIALLVFSCFYFPFYSAPHALLGLLLAGMLVARGRDSGSESPARPRAQRVAALVVGGCAMLIFPLLVWVVILPSYRLRAAMDLHLAGADPIPAYERTLSAGWAPIETHEKLGLALLQAGDSEGAEREFTIAFRGMDTGAVYMGLGASLLQQGKTTEAKEALESCVSRWPSHAAAWELLYRVTPEGERTDLLRRANRWLDADEMGAGFQADR